MKRIGVIAVLLGLGLALAPALRAQDLSHAEFGAFAEYFKAHQTNTNFGGVGGRLSVNAGRYFQVEAEMGYDFTAAYNQTFFRPGVGGTTTTVVQRSDYRILHGLFGPKIQMGGPVKLFVTVKGGFDDFMFDPRPVGFSSFTSSVDNLAVLRIPMPRFTPARGLRYFSDLSGCAWTLETKSSGPTVRATT